MTASIATLVIVLTFKTVTYDSKHSNPCYCSDFQNSNIEKWFSKNRVYGDKKRETIHRWSTKKVLEYKEQKDATEGLS